MTSDPSEMAKKFADLYKKSSPKPQPKAAKKPQLISTAEEAREHEIYVALHRIKNVFPSAENEQTWQRLLHLIANPLQAPKGNEKLSAGQVVEISHRTQEAYAVAGDFIDSTNPARKRNQQVDELAKWLIGSPDHLSLKSPSGISAAFSNWTERAPFHSRSNGLG